MPRIADPEERRTEVVEAAFRLLSRDGVEALTMRAVAKEAGCTIGLINHWFQSKDHLVDAALDRAVSSARERSAKAIGNSNISAEKALAEFLPLDDVRKSELRVWLAFWALGVSRPHMQDLHEARYMALRDELKREALTRGVPADKTTLYADIVMPLIDGIMANALLTPNYWTPTRQLRSLRWVLNAFEREHAMPTLDA